MGECVRPRHGFQFLCLLLLPLPTANAQRSSGPLPICNSTVKAATEACASAPEFLWLGYADYSQEARELRQNAEIQFSLVISNAGIPGEIQVVKSLGSLFDEPAIAALKKCRFRPGVYKGRPVSVKANLVMNIQCSTRTVVGAVPARGTHYVVSMEVRGADRLTKSMRDCGHDAKMLSKEVCEPLLVNRVAPVVGEDWEKTEKKGVVDLSVEICTDGRVYNIQVIKSVDGESDAKAVEAARQWRFRPATSKGNPIPVHAVMEFPFWTCLPLTSWGVPQ